MHPAFSVIFLTTLIGVGQGLFLALFTGRVVCRSSACCRRRTARFYALGSALALALPGRRPDRFVLPSRPSRARLALGGEVAHLLAVARGDRAAGLHGRGVPLRRGALRSAAARRWRRCRPPCRWADFAARRRWHRAVLRAVRLHRHDLRLPAVPAGMAHAADGDQLHCCSAAPPASLLATRLAALRGAASWPVLRRLGDDPDRCWRWSARAASLLRNARLKPKSTLQHGDRRQAPAHRAEGAGLHGRFVQHARVLPRQGAALAALGEMDVSAAGVPAAAAAAGRGGLPWRRRRCCWRRLPCSISACSPSAGSSSPRPTIRRTCITRRFPELAEKEIRCCALAPAGCAAPAAKVY